MSPHSRVPWRYWKNPFTRLQCSFVVAIILPLLTSDKEWQGCRCTAVAVARPLVSTHGAQHSRWLRCRSQAINAHECKMFRGAPWYLYNVHTELLVASIQTGTPRCTVPQATSARANAMSARWWTPSHGCEQNKVSQCVREFRAPYWVQLAGAMANATESAGAAAALEPPELDEQEQSDWQESDDIDDNDLPPEPEFVRDPPELDKGAPSASFSVSNPLHGMDATPLLAMAALAVIGIVARWLRRRGRSSTADATVWAWQSGEVAPSAAPLSRPLLGATLAISEKCDPSR